LLVILFLSLGTGAALAFPGQEPAPGSGRDWPGQPAMHGSYLGVNVVALSAERAQALGLKKPTGVEVTLVDQDAPAGKAGVREGDVIVSLNGKPVESEEQLRHLVRRVPPGNIATLGITRGSQLLYLQATLVDRAQFTRPATFNSGAGFPAPPDFPPMPFVFEFDMPTFTSLYISDTGAALEELSPQLCQYLGIKNGRGGVLVRAVEKGSPADQGGLKPGDVVIQVEKEWVANIDDWVHAISRRRAAYALTVVRDKRETSLSIKFSVRRQAATP
jgi:serine protease Do